MPDPGPPAQCVVLVPINGPLDSGCDDGLKELERRGHPVWRVRGYSAVDAARNQMATDALAQGFDELMWVDADVAFDPADVARLRAHGLPFTCGLYPKKGPRQFAAEFLPGTPAIRFGKNGGLVEIRRVREIDPLVPLRVAEALNPDSAALVETLSLAEKVEQ